MHTAEHIIKLLPATPSQLARALYGTDDVYARNAVYAHICLARRKYNIISLRIDEAHTGNRVLYIPGDGHMNCDNCEICHKGTEPPDAQDIENAIDRVLADESLWSRYCDVCRTQVYDTLLTYINITASIVRNRQQFWQTMIALRTMLRAVCATGCKHSH